MNDYISRQAVLEVVKSMPNDNPSYWHTCDVIDREDTLDEIEGLPSVTPTERTGHWLYAGENKRDKWLCDLCFDEVAKPKNFCPNCGARMESEDNE